MEKFDQTPGEEESIRERIQIIERIPLGVTPTAEAVLVLLGEKPVAELWPASREKAEEASRILLEAGLFSEVVEKTAPSGEIQTLVEVARSPELLEELKASNSWDDPIRYGTLMGYPESAVHAYASGNNEEMLPVDEGRSMTSQLPRVLIHYRFSKAHADTEMEHLTNWMRTIARHAPELIRRLEPKMTDTHIKRLLDPPR